MLAHIGGGGHIPPNNGWIEKNPGRVLRDFVLFGNFQSRFVHNDEWFGLFSASAVEEFALDKDSDAFL